MPENRQLVTFSLGSYYFGIDVTSVQEIIRTRSLAPVPLSHPAVLGLLNLRGQIVTVIDLKERLNFPQMEKRRRDGDAMNVIVRTESGPVSLQVDAIGDVLDVDESMFEPPPRSVGKSVRDFVAGLYKLEGKILHVLAVEKVVDFGSRASRTRSEIHREDLALEGAS